MDHQPTSPPTSLRELLAYLADHPKVRVTSTDPRLQGACGERAYSHAGEGRLYFTDQAGKSSFLPVDCTLTDAAARAESGLSFRPDGFTFEKFGAALVYTYLE